MRDATSSVGLPRDLHNQVNGCGDLRLDGLFRQAHVAHHCHCFHAGQGVSRSIGVDRRQRPVVTGVHCLQHVQAFLAANFAEHDAVRTHTKCIHYQLSLTNRTGSFHIWRPGFEAHNMLLLH